MRNTKLSKYWDSLQSSYWFLPTVMAIASLLLAFVMVRIDQIEALKTGEISWLYSGGPDGARGLLSAVASSMVTVAATVFSITVVALQLASSNFGPRLLRNFMQDTGNQLVLGTFIATFLYSLLVLRTIHSENYDAFVPQLSVTVGIGMAIASIGVLIYFIHHASTIIQASHVIASVADELESTIDRLFPEELGLSERAENTPDTSTLPSDFESQSSSVQSLRSGYLQIIDEDLLLKLARQYNLLLCLKIRPGEFVIKGKTLLWAYPGVRVSSDLTSQVNQAFIMGSERTEQQDVEFPVNQLVEIALRALSPGINDPFTAMRCIDRLSDGLAQLVQRPIPSSYRYDSQKRLRIIAEPVPFETIVDLAFSQIRRYAASDLAVTIRLLEALELIAISADNSANVSILRRHVDDVYQSSQSQFTEKCDRQLLESRYQAVNDNISKQIANINRAK